MTPKQLEKALLMRGKTHPTLANNAAAVTDNAAAVTDNAAGVRGASSGEGENSRGTVVHVDKGDIGGYLVLGGWIRIPTLTLT